MIYGTLTIIVRVSFLRSFTVKKGKEDREDREDRERGQGDGVIVLRNKRTITPSPCPLRPSILPNT